MREETRANWVITTLGLNSWLLFPCSSPAKSKNYFIELAPFPGFLLSKALEDGGHDLVEVLAMLMWTRIEQRLGGRAVKRTNRRATFLHLQVVGGLSQLLLQSTRGAPGIVAGGLSDLLLHLGVVHDLGRAIFGVGICMRDKNLQC